MYYMFDRAQQFDVQQNKQTEMLLDRLKKMEEEKEQLAIANKQLTEENQQLKNNLNKSHDALQQLNENMVKNAETKASDILRMVFTPGQVKKLMSPSNNRIMWSAEDISSAIALWSVSARAYNYLRDVKNIPLPCVQTLRNWSATFNVKPGILHNVLQIMQIKGQDLSAIEKLTVLSFVEIYISNKVDLERRQQKIYGPHKTSQFVMARGLFGKWKQPIFYEYDKPMTKDILIDIITCLQEAGYTVVAVTSDLGSTNASLWKSINIGIKISNFKNSKLTNKPGQEKQCFFLHPLDNNLKIFVFADVPHLIKLARNNLFDSGFIINGQLVDKQILEELVALNSRDLKIAFNLSKAHLDVKGNKRQSVKLAAQVFSLRNAKAIEYCGKQGFFSQKNWQVMSDILKLFNDWFDLLNCESKFGKHSGLRAYGVELQKQDIILDKMNEFVRNMRTPNRSTLLPFQKGILLTNQSLKQLLQYMKEQYSSDTFTVEYIITRRLSQDILENFFSYIRSMGATNDHPSPVELQNRLKWYILGKHSGCALSMKKNTEDDLMSVPFMDLQDVHSNAPCTLDCLDDFHDEDDVTEEAELFLENDRLHTCVVDEDQEDEDLQYKKRKIMKMKVPKLI